MTVVAGHLPVSNSRACPHTGIQACSSSSPRSSSCWGWRQHWRTCSAASEAVSVYIQQGKQPCGLSTLIDQLILHSATSLSARVLLQSKPWHLSSSLQQQCSQHINACVRSSLDTFMRLVTAGTADDEGRTDQGPTGTAAAGYIRPAWLGATGCWPSCRPDGHLSTAAGGCPGSTGSSTVAAAGTSHCGLLRAPAPMQQRCSAASKLHTAVQHMPC